MKEAKKDNLFAKKKTAEERMKQKMFNKTNVPHLTNDFNHIFSLNSVNKNDPVSTLILLLNPIFAA